MTFASLIGADDLSESADPDADSDRQNNDAKWTNNFYGVRQD